MIEVILQKAGQVVHPQNSAHTSNMYSQLMKVKALHILALFALLYVGAEVTIGGTLLEVFIQ